MKKKFLVTGTLNVRILHSEEVEIEVDEDMNEYEIEDKAKAELESVYYDTISPVLKGLDDVTDEWEIRDHDEEVQEVD